MSATTQSTQNTPHTLSANAAIANDLCKDQVLSDEDAQEIIIINSKSKKSGSKLRKRTMGSSHETISSAATRAEETKNDLDQNKGNSSQVNQESNSLCGTS